MKKFLCLLLSLSFVLTAFAASDIKGHWAEEYISNWILEGNIGGYPDGTFRPNNNITRAEFATLLNRIVEEPAGEFDYVEFSDVLDSDWYYSDVMRLAYFGVIAKADKFYPNRNITREEAITMIARAYGLSGEKSVTFTDSAQISSWATESINALCEKGAIAGYPDGTIRPKNKLTRAETVKMLDVFAPKADLTTLSGILDATYKRSGKEFAMVMQQEINEENSEYFIGIPFTDIAEGVASEPMMSAQAHSVCLVKVKDQSKASAIAEQIRNKVDPRKWVCVGIERGEVITVVRGDLILLIMDRTAPKALENSFIGLDLGEGYENLADIPRAEGSAEGDKLLYHNGQYLSDLGEYKSASALKFADKINYITENYVSEEANAFYAVIPSKNYYVNAQLPTYFDYDAMFATLRENINGAYEIKLFDTLSYDDYLSTDIHWKQESLQGVVDRLGSYFDFSVDLSSFKKNTAENFKGQLGYGKENFPTESITYLTNSATDSAKVENYQDASATKVYDTEKLSTTSQYDLFLSGPTPLTTIKNDSAKSDKRLIIFRDSFGSSLAPLLAGEYKEIVLVDLRYMVSSALDEMVDFEGADVLFIFNDQIVNNATMLK